jgi:hypothetical protein
MKTIKYLAMFFLLLIPAYGYANEFGPARLSMMEGDVQVLIQDTTDWTPATINLPMNEHDRLWVPDDSKAELQIQGGVYVRAEGNSALDILTLNRDSTQFYLDRGHIYINNREGGVKTVQVDSPMASLRSYDNSVMMVDVSEDGLTEISVLQGTVYAESKAGATTVNSGSTLTIRGESNAEISPISSPDEWEQWNRDRDQQVSAWNESSRYLPAELDEYSADFDQYGRWDYVGDYGYVWFPSITVSWAPYSYGNWVWIRGNYVWVDYAPWAWAPSHFGRWVFISSRGWCWVPPAVGAVYWAPGYVGWVITSGYVAWVPLAPGEIYYGYGYYGPGSVNITTVNINTVVVNRTYRNARERNSVVVVRRDTFGTGRHVPVQIQENPFEARGRNRHNVNIVPPRVRPERPITIAPPEAREYTRRELQRGRRTRTIETPAIPAPQRNAPPTAGTEPKRTERRDQQPAASPRVVSPPTGQVQQQQPPERVRRNRPETMKNERPLIRQREASVFKPQQQENLTVTRSREPRVINRKPAPRSSQQQQPEVQSQQQERRQQPQRQGHQRNMEERGQRR